MHINAYSTRRDSTPHGFTPVDERPRWTPEGTADEALTNHLGEFADYVRTQIPEHTSDEPVLRHVNDVQRFYRFELDERDPGQLAALTEWAARANAILVTSGSVLDGLGRPLLPGAHGAASGVVPVLDEARQRADQVRNWLASARGVQVSPSLAPVRSESEVMVQRPRDVALRTIALVMVSDFSSSLTAGRPIDPRDMRAVFPQAFDIFSPEERALFEHRDPQMAIQLSWRIEAAQTLLWAIGRTTLTWPSRSANTDEIKQLVLSRGEQAFLDGAELRTDAELLNDYECLYALNWAIDQADSHGGAPVPDTDPGVAGERLSALSWLLNRQLPWDEADTRDRVS